VRPTPTVTLDNQFFWDAASDSRLVGQRCSSCRRLMHPPRPACPVCQSLDSEIVEFAGTGTIYSYAVLHHPRHPSFDYPLVAVLVDLDEGIRLVSDLAGVGPDEVRIGMRVQVTFEPRGDASAVPVFVVADGDL
jgi:uncharacterized protein